MKESYSEGIANHTGPESCVGYPRGGGEALTGVHTGWVLNREIVLHLWVPTDLDMSGRQHQVARQTRERLGPRVVVDPMHVRKLLARESGDPTSGLVGPLMLVGKRERNRDLQPTSDKTRERGAPGPRLQSPECAHCLARSTGAKTDSHRDVGKQVTRHRSHDGRAEMGQMAPGPRCESDRRRQR